MASVFDDLDLSSVSIETQTDEASFVPERGLLGDIGSRFARGAVRTTALAGSALETLGIDTPLSDIAEEAPKKLDFLKPDVSEFLGKEGFISRGIKGGIESLIPSLSAGLPTGIAGAQIGSLLGPAGTAAGGVIGAVLGTVGLFGLGTYGEAKKEYLRENPDDFEGAHDFALRAGLIEGGVESLATGAEILTSGLAKGITTPLRTTIKTMLKSTPKEIATAYAKTAGIEVSTEVFQGVAEAQNRGEFGLETLSPVEAGMESIVPAMTMSFLFSSGSSIYNNRQQNKLIKNLQSDNPQLQKASNELIRKNLQKQDPEFAEAWSLATDESLRNGRPLDINADFVKLGNQLGEERAEEAIDRVRVADLEEDSLKLQSVLDEGRSAEDAFEEVYGGLGQEAEQTKALEKVAEIPGEVPTTKEKFAKAAEEAKKDLKPEDKVELFETPEQEAKQKVVDTKVTAEITAKVKAKKAPKTPKVSKEKRIEELTTKGRAGEATVAELTELGELRFGKEEFAEKRKGVDLGGAAKERRDKDTKEAIESVPGGVSELKVIQEAGLGVETSQRGALAPSETQEKVATVSSPTTKGGTIKWKQEETAKTRTDRSGIITGTSPKSGKSFTLVKQKGKEWALAVDGKAVGTFEREEAKKIAEGEIVAEGKEWKESGSLKGGDFKATSGIWEIRSSGKKAVHIVLNGQVIRRSLNGNKISVAKAKQFIKESDVKAPTVTKKGEAATREVKEPTAVTAKVPKKVPAEQKPSEVTEVKVSPEEEAKILKRSAKAQKKSFIADEKGRGYILEDLAALTYKAGMSLGAFAKKMRAALGKAYASIRNKIKSLYEAAQNHLDKVTLGREVGAIGGAKAATANKAKLSLAIALDKKGERPDNILADTGWFKPRDGKWRFFITDKDMKLQESYEELSSMIFRVRDLQANQRLIKKETMKMEPGDPKRNKFLDQFDKNSDELKEIRKRTQGLPLFSIITHPKLAKAYASVGLAKVKVNFEWDSSRVGSWEGSYDTRTNTISINLGSTGIQGAKDKRVRGTMIHEIQHAIQKIEGFTGGGSPESAATMNNRLMFNGLYARAIETKNTEIVDILDNKLTEGGGAFEEELQRRQKENPDTPEDILIDKLVGEELLKLYESNEDVQHLIDQDDLLAHRHENILVHASKDQQTYEAILGEMEANLADVTKDLTEQQVIQRQLSSG
ncbi:MAG: hypothetical protein KAS32_18230, partial [Candidatus Peribacteraceae bacterium]|nr:hypothetical protein [Candidatus Peribacteraceae bacterium]